MHASYLARGGLDFLIADGRLNYAPEYVWESYYSARLLPGFYASLDAQWDANLAYNHDRGPVWVCSVRLHMEYGLKPRQANNQDHCYGKLRVTKMDPRHALRTKARVELRRRNSRNALLYFGRRSLPRTVRLSVNLISDDGSK